MILFECPIPGMTSMTELQRVFLLFGDSMISMIF